MIKIICVGKVKEKYLRDAISDYEKRISKYYKIDIIEVNDSNMKEEAIKIKQHIKSNDYVITLEIEGNMLTSIELANKIDKIFITNPYFMVRNEENTFIVGGSDGLDKSIKEISNYKLSFSKFTFPHQLFRVVLLEQIYRSCKILNNETYHK